VQSETRPTDTGAATTPELTEIDRQRALGIPARPLFGRLPVARRIPQDVHAVMDYAGSALLVWAGLRADSVAATATGVALGVAQAATSLLTDYRPSGAKLVPIEVHQALDHAVGLTALLAPLWMGKRRRDRQAAAVHLVVGGALVLGSLLTDYRARHGRTWPAAQRLLGTQP
jgi:hypothetical protein